MCVIKGRRGGGVVVVVAGRLVGEVVLVLVT